MKRSRKRSIGRRIILVAGRGGLPGGESRGWVVVLCALLPLPNLTHIALINSSIAIYAVNYRRRCSSRCSTLIPLTLRQVTRHPQCVPCCPTFHSRRLMGTPLLCMVRTVRTAREHKSIANPPVVEGPTGSSGEGDKAIMVSIWWVTRALRTATPPTPAVTHTTRHIHVTPSQGRPYSRAAEAASYAGEEGGSEESTEENMEESMEERGGGELRGG